MRATSQLVPVMSALLTLVAPVGAQETRKIALTPERAGFTPHSVTVGDEVVRFYVSTDGNPQHGETKRPLVLYLDGSGPSPLFYRDKGRISSSLVFDARDFDGYHFAVISKPGVQFFEESRQVTSREYDRRQSLRWRVNAANAVIDKLVADGIVNGKRVLVLGHSEGSDVAPWVALENTHVTHVAALAPGGLSLMLDYIALTRRQIATGEITQAEGDELIRNMKADFRRIYSDPTSTEKKWSGETHKRWSTFFRPAMDAWRQLDKPAYLGICRDDRNTAVESGEAIELEFIRLGKKNFKSTIWPCDHYMIETSKPGESADRRLDVLQEVLEWVKETPPVKSKSQSQL